SDRTVPGLQGGREDRRSRADVSQRHFHHCGEPHGGARDFDPVRIRWTGPADRAASARQLFRRGEDPRRRAPVPGSDRLASQDASGSRAMIFEIVIGLETHAQLSTASKIFSGASTAFGAAPNTQASAVDIALPGVLPVLNRGAVERAIRFGLAVGATIHRRSVFARKNYFYPDLPKGYQISQYEIPIVQGGSLSIATPAGEKTVRLTRAHLEEDAGKSLHEDYHGMTGI